MLRVVCVAVEDFVCVGPLYVDVRLSLPPPSPFPEDLISPSKRIEPERKKKTRKKQKTPPFC